MVEAVLVQESRGQEVREVKRAELGVEMQAELLGVAQLAVSAAD